MRQRDIGGNFSDILLRVATDFTTTTASAAVTGLSATLAAGQTYSFEGVIYLTISDAAQTANIHMNNSTTGTGGQATKTDLRWGAEIFEMAGHLFGFCDIKTAMNQSLATTTTNSDTSFVFKFHGTITVNAGGTFGPYLGSSDVGNTATVKRGSFMRIWKY